jgi:hypothetical protein
VRRLIVGSMASMVSLATSAAWLCVCLAAAAPPCGGYEVEILPNIPCPGPLHDPGLLGKAVNSSGVVAGTYLDICTFGDLIDEGFTWSPEAGVFTIPRPPGVISLQAFDISDTGLVVGRHADISFFDPGMYGFIYDGKRLVNLYTLPGGTFSQATAVNSIGTVVVGAWGNTLTGVPTARGAFVWSRGVLHNLWAELGTSSSDAFDVSSTGAVTGWMGTFAQTDIRAYIWQPGQGKIALPPVPGGLTSEGIAIADDGWVAGHGKTPLPGGGTTWRCFVWDGRSMMLPDLLPGTKSCRVTGMTNNHDVIGYCSDGPDFDTRPFLWSQGVMHELRDYVRLDGLELYNPEGVNDRGEIVIHGLYHDEGHTMLLHPMAEVFADLTCDGAVGTSDLQLLLSMWGPCATRTCAEDLDQSGTVNGFDLAMLLAEWSPL